MNAIIYETIEQLCRRKNGRAVVAVDGMCCSGKSTIAAEIKDAFGGTVIHADSFFLPPEMRTAERLNEPGGNFHRERFKKEVIERIGSDFEYGVFDCSVGRITHIEKVSADGLIIVEGSYCMHPALNAGYNLKIFSETSPVTQLKRIFERDGGAALESFKNKWIPFENKYFEHFNIKNGCDITVVS